MTSSDDKHSDPVTERVAEDNRRVNSRQPLSWALLLGCLILVAASYYVLNRGAPARLVAGTPAIPAASVGERAPR